MDAPGAGRILAGFQSLPRRSPVNIRIVYAAHVQDLLGIEQEHLAVSAPLPTVQSVIYQLVARGGRWAEAFAHPGRTVLSAVNHQVVRRDHPLGPGDELALFIPVPGM